MKAPQIARLAQKYRELREPLLYDDATIFVNSSTWITAFERGSMAIKWSIPGQLEALHQGTLVVRNLKKHCMQGLSASDRREIWRTPGDSWRDGLWNGHLLDIIDGSVGLQSCATGHTTWLPMPYSRLRAPSGAIDGNALPLAHSVSIEGVTVTPRLLAIELPSGAILWDRNLADETGAGPKPGMFEVGPMSGGAFLFRYGDTVAARAGRDGSVQWQIDINAETEKLLGVGETVLLWSGGRLVGRDFATGEVRFEAPHEPLHKYDWPRIGLRNGQLVLVSMGGRLEVIDLTDGSVINEYALITNFSDAAIIDGQTVVTTTLDVRVFDGSLWERKKPRTAVARKAPVIRMFKPKRLIAQTLGELPDEAMTFETRPPLAVHDVTSFRHVVASAEAVVLTGQEQGLYALEPQTYRLRWRHADVPTGFGTPAPEIQAGMVMVYDSTANVLRGWHLDTGHPAWTLGSSPMFFRSGDFIVASDWTFDTRDLPRKIRVFDPAANVTVFEFATPWPYLEGVTERVALVSGDSLCALDLRDGTELWRRGRGTRRIRTVDSGVFVAEVDGRLEAASIHTGDLIWEGPSDSAYGDGRWWWDHRYEEKCYRVRDIVTGEITVVPARHGARLTGRFDGYVVGPATRGVFFFDRSRPAQLLPLSIAVNSQAVQAGDDLIFIEPMAVKVIRRRRQAS
jgi:outer membrane protein assembly factor BamB